MLTEVQIHILYIPLFEGGQVQTRVTSLQPPVADSFLQTVTNDGYTLLIHRTFLHFLRNPKVCKLQRIRSGPTTIANWQCIERGILKFIFHFPLHFTVQFAQLNQMSKSAALVLGMPQRKSSVSKLDQQNWSYRRVRNLIATGSFTPSNQHYQNYIRVRNNLQMVTTAEPKSCTTQHRIK